MLSRLQQLRTEYLLFLFLASVYLVLGRGMVTSTDAMGMLRVTESIVERGSFAVDKTRVADCVPGLDGKYYSIHGLGKSLVNIPPYILAIATYKLVPGFPREHLVHFFVSQVNPVLSAGVGVLLFVLCRRMGRSLRMSLALACLHGLGSIAFPYAKDDMSEPLAMVLVLGGVILTLDLLTKPTMLGALAAGCCFGGAVTTRYVLAVVPFICGAVLLAAWLNRGGLRVRHLMGFFGILTTFAGLLIWFNVLRFGSPIETGYDKAGGGVGGFKFFDLRFIHNMACLVLSPGRGVLAYMPYLALVLFGVLPSLHRDRWGNTLLLLLFLALFLVVAGYEYFHGGVSWGPRLLMPVLPLLYPILGAAIVRLRSSRAMRAVIWMMVIYSVVINFAAVIVSWQRYTCFQGMNEAQGRVYDRNWSVADSQIVNQFWNVWDVVTLPEEKRKLLSVSHQDNESAFRGSRSLNLMSIWPVRLRYEGVPLAGILPVATFLLVVACASGLQVAGRLMRGARP